MSENREQQEREDIEANEASDSLELQNTGAFRWLGRRQVRKRVITRWISLAGLYVFSSLTRRILVLNLVGLLAMVISILYLNQFQAGLIDARVQSLLVQGEIIAGAIAASTTSDDDSLMVDPEQLLRLEAGETTSARSSLGSLDFPINPEIVGPILRRLISPTKTRARIYDPEGMLMLDSRQLHAQNQIFRFDLPPPDETSDRFFQKMWEELKLWMRRGEYPPYKEVGRTEGREYPEVEAALAGSPASVVRVGTKGEMVVAVAVPIQRFRGVLGALLLSTQGGDIDDIVAAERNAILKIFIVAAVVVMILSVLLAGTIAGPVRRLSEAAQRVQSANNTREEIPEFKDRYDEIGDLARSLRNMTNSLYDRMDAIESFAADVAHELKNPLTSLRSAVETLPLARNENSRERLLEVIQHDVKRLDRLITDISEASRIDAEMSRAESRDVNMATLLEAVVSIANERAGDDIAHVNLKFEPANTDNEFVIHGNDQRIGQVFNNLIDNARSFAPEGTAVTITANRQNNHIIIWIDDCGPGIRAELRERVFERFYTDRPENEGFGNNSGLGLSICRQIIEAHRGEISAINRTFQNDGEEEKVLGARFVIRLRAKTSS
ncbi:Signal transduction histidine-protein kinase BaeS [Pseudovibrio axinellae]|uniref:histidine kinase n=1 Tax=Pseudovibrio axinellae TaxID=989403 RepID=A0A165ZZV3_9HYPH|nr:sensor histidine kinase [Pseudovibrio axinellae]KZL20471.1 Signal transduction histidine-protein kinase BaeS [Pseudovibrio axinellae]SEQ37708.1 two-component system, OmpR family, sensor histidine kinase ChvG [Pseudovibrio axinellae]